jgi:hypothetical protein
VKDYYVILTGSKNNAGDFLIKYRAKKLFAALRPDRDIVDLDAWKPFDAPTLAQVNNAKALILMGGPALQANMYPGIYPLTANLDDITTPVTTMGVGWKSINGSWQDTYDYPLAASTLRLLNKAAGSGLPLSVRDFHTFNALAFKGIDNVVMTGCPAYYDLDFIGKPFDTPGAFNKVAFSLGVALVDSPAMEQAMKAQIVQLKKRFADSAFEVVFHHGLNPDTFLKAHSSGHTHNSKHRAFADWLAGEGIAYVDISGSAERLMEYYAGVDLHIGYRVHAHIFMNSVRKASVLIAEDGRGRAVEKVIGGIVIDGVDHYKNDFFSKVASKLLPGFERYVANASVSRELEVALAYEKRNQGRRFNASRCMIDENFEVMKDFLARLP